MLGGAHVGARVSEVKVRPLSLAENALAAGGHRLSSAASGGLLSETPLPLAECRMWQAASLLSVGGGLLWGAATLLAPVHRARCPCARAIGPRALALQSWARALWNAPFAPPCI